MRTDLGDKLAKVDARKADNPALQDLIQSLHGTAGGKYFNDTQSPHTDYKDRLRGGAHTDRAGVKTECPKPDVDIEYPDGTNERHTDDQATEASPHTDSAYNDHTDMTR